MQRKHNMEDRLKVVEGDVKQILENHLPHLRVELAKLSTSMRIFGGLIIAGITALIILGLTP